MSRYGRQINLPPRAGAAFDAPPVPVRFVPIDDPTASNRLGGL